MIYCPNRILKKLLLYTVYFLYYILYTYIRLLTRRVMSISAPLGENPHKVRFSIFLPSVSIEISSNKMRENSTKTQKENLKRKIRIICTTKDSANFSITIITGNLLHVVSEKNYPPPPPAISGKNY